MAEQRFGCFLLPSSGDSVTEARPSWAQMSFLWLFSKRTECSSVSRVWNMHDHRSRRRGILILHLWGQKSHYALRYIHCSGVEASAAFENYAVAPHLCSHLLKRLFVQLPHFFLISQQNPLHEWISLCHLFLLGAAVTQRCGWKTNIRLLLYNTLSYII